MGVQGWVLFGVVVLALLLVVLRNRRPDVRDRYDRWGVGHGSFSGRTAGWFGDDGSTADPRP